jgi:1-acyl-sn-glycerol-3-phosphate acyltransferase
MNVWYSTAKTIVRSYTALFMRSVQVFGQENLPPGAKIIVANHANMTDSFVLPFIIREKLHFLIQADAFNLPFLGGLLKRAEQIPVSGRRGNEALNAALEWLARGDAVVIYPEGLLNHGESFRRAGTGAARLAMESGAPIIPFGIYVPDSYARLMKWYLQGRDRFARWQFGGQCFIQIGEPWHPLIEEMDKNYRSLRIMTHQMMAQILDLVEQAKEEAGKLGVNC